MTFYKFNNRECSLNLSTLEVRKSLVFILYLNKEGQTGL